MNKLLFVVAGLLCCGVAASADAPVSLVVPEATADSAAVWAGITGGQVSPAQSWQDGLLDAATVQTGLSKGVAAGQNNQVMQLRRELGELLAKNTPDAVADAEKLSLGVQLALADY